MPSTHRALQAIANRCRLALPLRYRCGSRFRAEQFLEAELRCLQHRGFEQPLVEIIEYGDSLSANSVRFHAIGAGGSSMLLFLLGISQVEPIQFRTNFHRLWSTASGESPQLSLVVLPDDRRRWESIPRPVHVRVHEMTPLEAVPELCRQRLPEVFVPLDSKPVFAALQQGETEGVFQLEAEPVRALLAELGPPRIPSLAVMTALSLIELSHPDVVRDYVQALQNRRQSIIPGRITRPSNLPPLPILFQETLMERFHREGPVRWDATYRLVQNTAKGISPPIPMSDAVQSAGQWAVCRAHHVANAITSYRAAYYRTFHRQQFEDVLAEVTAWKVTP